MAHFAQLDENNVVTQVIVIHNNELMDENGVEQEQRGIEFCKAHYGQDTNWIQTSYNGNFRKNYAGIGYTYDVQRDAFIPIKPFESWLLDEESCVWYPPIPMPQDGKLYLWDEPTLQWIAHAE